MIKAFKYRDTYKAKFCKAKTLMNELQRRTHNKHKLRYTTQNTLWFIFLNTLRFPVIYSDYLLLIRCLFSEYFTLHGNDMYSNQFLHVRFVCGWLSHNVHVYELSIIHCNINKKCDRRMGLNLNYLFSNKKASFL